MPILLLLFLLLWGGPAAAASPQQLVLANGSTLLFELPAGWVFSRTPPDFLVRETVADLDRDLAAKGKQLPPAQVAELARQRLLANEGFVYQATSRDLLLIDFSPLGPGEAAPDARALERSARYAADSLRQEPDAAEVEIACRPATLAWLPQAWRLDAHYRLAGTPRRFIGIIGFHAPFWIYLYYTDRGGDPAATAALEKLLQSARIAPRSGPGK